MKGFTLSMLGAALGVALVLFLYDQFVAQPRAQRQQQAAQVDLTQAARQAEAITANLDASVQRSVETARQAFDAQAADQRKRAWVAEALAQTQRYKVALTEAYLNRGQWPVSATDAGLPARDTPAGGALRSIEVDDDGSIVLEFDHNFARGARLRLLPQGDPATSQLHWRCTTEGDPDLERYLPQCVQD